MPNKSPKPAELELIQAFPFEFYGEIYVAYLATDRQFYLKLVDICNGMGLEPNSQRRRILNDDAISDKLAIIQADTVYKDSVRKRDVAFLNIRALPYWLGTVDAKRIRPEIQEKVMRFKRSFAETAWQVYRSDLMPSEVLAEMDTYETPETRELVEIHDQARALQKRIEGMEGRLTAIEARMGSGLIITPLQQRQILIMIEAVGEALFENQKGKMPKTQCHALAQNEFKAKFQIPVYSLLPENRMDEAVSHLTQQYQHLKPGVKLPEIFSDGIQRTLL
ncbi:MAG: phage antirepressor N-terminal domain-containing protein [Anaerolineales bacterium]